MANNRAVCKRWIFRCAGFVLFGVMAPISAEDQPSITKETALDHPAASEGLSPLHAHGQSNHILIDVSYGADPFITVTTTPTWKWLLVGVAGIPLAGINPQIGLGAAGQILYTPINTLFNARYKSLAQVFRSEPLANHLVTSLVDRLSGGQYPHIRRIQARILSYGLTPRSGAPVTSHDLREAVCLVAQTSLLLTREGSEAHEGKVEVNLEKSDTDLPPPICASVSRFAEDDGTYLRQSIAELAEVLASVIQGRIEALR